MHFSRDVADIANFDKLVQFENELCSRVSTESGRKIWSNDEQFEKAQEPMRTKSDDRSKLTFCNALHEEKHHVGTVVTLLGTVNDRSEAQLENIDA
jgi:hypothetical protein